MRNKFTALGGPDGGDGGRGAHIILRGNSNLWTLLHLRYYKNVLAEDGERGGANMAKVREAITGGFADSRILQVHGQRMVERDFVPRGRMSVQLKDLRNALATANEIGFSAPITALFEQLYAQGIEHGLEDLDQSALFVELASRNGMT